MYSLEEETYLYDITILLKTLLSHIDKVCYISFNKTGESIRVFCDQNNIDFSRILVIDMISPRLRDCKNTDNIFYTNLENLTDAAKEIIKIMENNSCRSYILDSLSTMNIYYDEKQLLKFTHELLVYTESKHMISNLIIQRHDEKKEWLKSIIPLVGKPKEIRSSETKNL